MEENWCINALRARDGDYASLRNVFVFVMKIAKVTVCTCNTTE